MQRKITLVGGERTCCLKFVCVSLKHVWVQVHFFLFSALIIGSSMSSYHMGSIWAHSGSNMGPYGPQMGPILGHTYAQNGPNMVPHNGPIMVPLWEHKCAPMGPNMGPIWVHGWACRWAHIGPRMGPYGPHIGPNMGPHSRYSHGPLTHFLVTKQTRKCSLSLSLSIYIYIYKI
jgi:hypothetical protein